MALSHGSIEGVTRVAIGAPNNQEAGGYYQGHVLLFQYTSLSTTSWEQVAYDIDGQGSGESSGHSVAMSEDGKCIAIGSPHFDGTNGYYRGVLRVYEQTEYSDIPSSSPSVDPSDVPSETPSRSGVPSLTPSTSRRGRRRCN